MSLHRPYPPDTYTGERGEASAWLRRGDEAPDITHRNGGTCEYLATGDRTEGRFGLYRWTFGETEPGPTPTSTAPSPSSSTCCPGRFGSTTAATG